MRSKLDRFVLWLILAPLAPLTGLLLCWWGAYAFLPEVWIPFVAISGLLAGLLVDAFFLNRLLDRRLSLLFWAAVFLFYSIGTFGFFMGVPVFNALLAVPAGFVIGSRLAAQGAGTPQAGRAAHRTAWFTSAVLALICAASAFLALASPSTPSDLRGMLGLGFEPGWGMLIGLILVGGAALLALCWGLSVASVHLTVRLLKRPA
jgi:hypothetical protein